MYKVYVTLEINERCGNSNVNVGQMLPVNI